MLQSYLPDRSRSQYNLTAGAQSKQLNYQDVATINARDIHIRMLHKKELLNENFLRLGLPSYFYSVYIVNVLNVLSFV